MNAPSDSIECWADRPVVQLTNQVNRVIARPMSAVQVQFTRVAHVRTLALAILLGFIQPQTPQGRSQTPSTLLFSSRLELNGRNVKLAEQSKHLPPHFTPTRLDESRRQCKKNPGLTGRDFPSFPLAFAARGQDSRIQHSLAPLTRHPGRNEQKSRLADRRSRG